MKNAKEKENFKDDYLQEKVDSRIEDHLRKLGYETSKKSFEFKQLRSNFIELWVLRNELKEQQLLNNEESNLNEWYKQKCNEKFGLDFPVSMIDLLSESPSPSIIQQETETEPDTEKILEVLPNFLNFWNKRDNKESTTQRYGIKVRHLAVIVGNLPLNKITSMD